MLVAFYNLFSATTDEWDDVCSQMTEYIPAGSVNSFPKRSHIPRIRTRRSPNRLCQHKPKFHLLHHVTTRHDTL